MATEVKEFYEQVREDIAKVIVEGGSIRKGRTYVSFRVNEGTLETIEYRFIKYYIERKWWKDQFPSLSIIATYSKRDEGFDNAAALMDFINRVLAEVVSS